ncbi:MAG TPA: energy-coupling factor transporter transmembrane protein EcfT [Chloroflexota bacterium]|nr:energy-coupling factor transporter transmembrane protein EcfT [Chloroflexota bacterium]
MRRVKLYHAADSWLHRLHPSAKLLLWVFLAFLLACLPWRLKVPIFLALVVALWSTRVPFNHYRLIVFLALPVMIVAPLLNALWPTSESDYVAAVIPELDWPLYYEGLRRGLSRDLLIGGSTLMTLILLTTTDLHDFAEAPTYLGAPHVVGFTIAAVMRYIPEVSNFLLTLYDVQEARGVDFYTRNPAVNFVRRTNILIPVLIFQLSRANRMSNAMESRGFQISGAPTLYSLRRLTESEKAVCALFGLVAVVITLLRVYVAFVPGDYPFEFGTF